MGAAPHPRRVRKTVRGAGPITGSEFRVRVARRLPPLGRSTSSGDKVGDRPQRHGRNRLVLERYGRRPVASARSAASSSDAWLIAPVFISRFPQRVEYRRPTPFDSVSEHFGQHRLQIVDHSPGGRRDEHRHLDESLHRRQQRLHDAARLARAARQSFVVVEALAVARRHGRVDPVSIAASTTSLCARMPSIDTGTRAPRRSPTRPIPSTGSARTRAPATPPVPQVVRRASDVEARSTDASS